MHHSLADSPYAVTPLLTPHLTPASAARILDLSERPRTRRAPSAVFLTILLLTAHIASSGGSPSLAQAAAMSAARASTRAGESPKMKRLMAIGAAAAVSMTSGAMAQSAVEWRVADGGNGHWYALMQRGSMIGWHEAVQQSAALGGYLATPTSAAENAFIFDLVPSELMLPGPWLGGFQDHSSPAYSEPRDGWSWVTGEPFVWTNWNGLAPNNDFCGGLPEDFLHFFNPMGEWNDLSELRGSCVAPLRTFIIEWSADCNNDGIVDYGQILVGDLTDANHNNIPDCCESNTSCACAGDTNADDQIDGIDLATILARWAQPAAKFPNADCNSDGLIDGIDLAIVLGGWGPCP
jgi:hypothetical protein